MQNKNALYTNRLRELRLQADLSQQETADLVDISLSSYQRYENGKREIPSEVLFRLSRVLRAPADYILMKADLETDFDYAFMDARGGVVELTEGEFFILHTFNNLNQEGQEILRAVAEALVSSGKYPKRR